MSIESVMPSNHLILCRPLLLLPSIFPSIRWESPIVHNQHSREAPTCERIQGKLREGEDGERQNVRGRGRSSNAQVPQTSVWPWPLGHSTRLTVFVSSQSTSFEVRLVQFQILALPGPHHVTPWVIKCLLVLQLSHTYSEHKVGPFFVDLLGELKCWWELPRLEQKIPQSLF